MKLKSKKELEKIFGKSVKIGKGKDGVPCIEIDAVKFMKEKGIQLGKIDESEAKENGIIIADILKELEEEELLKKRKR